MNMTKISAPFSPKVSNPFQSAPVQSGLNYAGLFASRTSAPPMLTEQQQGILDAWLNDRELQLVRNRFSYYA
jgi:hypothetical protein